MITLYAPQIRASQPAFMLEKNNKIRIYFSIPEMNDLNYIGGIQVVITNPRKSASSNGYSIYTETITNSGWSKINENYIEITLTEDLKNKFQVNQYYQAQLTFIKDDKEISEASQITLLRPIPTISKSKSKVDLNFTTREISGSIVYSDKSIIEAIKSYLIEIYENEVLVKTVGVIDNLSYGLSFSTIVDYYFKEGKSYNVKIDYTTINDFTGTIDSGSKSIVVLKKDPWPGNSTFVVSNNENGGAVLITISTSSISAAGNLLIQRSTEDSEFSAWETIATFKNITVFQKGYIFNWEDYSIEGGKIYQYRFKYEIDDDTTYLSSGYYITSYFGDIFLSTVERQLAIRYNPSISGFRWITQDSITNTLGGKYPLIRRNAQTKYRQFNLSGSIYIDPSDIYTGGKDSRGLPLASWVDDTESSLFLNNSELFKFDSSLDELKKYTQDEKIYEKRFKDLAIQFLTDGNIKLFRSFQEGNMIVYLSNVSFTPNKQLDRRVYDFSATVTELCEATEENLKKYSLYQKATNYRYVLKIIGEEETNLEYKPYISVDQMFSDNILILEYEEYTEDQL